MAPGSRAEAAPFLAALRTRFVPNRVLAVVAGPTTTLARLVPLVADKIAARRRADGLRLRDAASATCRRPTRRCSRARSRACGPCHPTRPPPTNRRHDRDAMGDDNPSCYTRGRCLEVDNHLRRAAPRGREPCIEPSGTGGGSPACLGVADQDTPVAGATVEVVADEQPGSSDCARGVGAGLNRCTPLVSVRAVSPPVTLGTDSLALDALPRIAAAGG